MSDLLPMKIDGDFVFVEVDQQAHTGVVAGSEDTDGTIQEKIQAQTEYSFDIARNIVIRMGKTFVSSLKRLEPAEIPEEFELSFGLKFSAEGNIYVAKVGTESTLNIRLTYKPRATDRGSTE